MINLFIMRDNRLADSARLWQNLAYSCRFLQIVADCGKLWQTLTNCEPNCTVNQTEQLINSTPKKWARKAGLISTSIKWNFR